MLIHSIIEDYLIPSNVVIKGVGVAGKGNSYSVIDGQQRLTTIMDYLQGKFTLDSSIPLFKKVPLELSIFEEDFTEELFVVDDLNEKQNRPSTFSSDRLISEDDEFVAFDASGLSVHDLPEELYMEFFTKSLSVTMYDSTITEEEIEELFFRLNNGTTLSKIQKTKARLGSKLINRVQSLVNHDFIIEITSFTKAQMKNEKDLELILTFLFLAELDEFSDMELPSSLSGAFIASYGEKMKTKSESTISMMFEKVEQVLNFLYSSLQDLISDKDIKTFFKKPVHIIPVYYTALTLLNSDISETDFATFIEIFITQFSNKKEGATKSIYVENYANNTGAGATKRSLLSARLDAMKEGFLYDMKDITSEI